MAAITGSMLQGGGSGLYLQGSSSPLRVTTNPQGNVMGARQLQPAAGAEINQRPMGTVAAPVRAAAPAPKPIPVDPWRKTPWGSKANYDRAVSDYNTAKNNAYSSINDLIGDTATKYNSGILDFLDTLRSGQRSIDRAATQNELARQEGRLGVLDMIGTGLRSGGVTLNNANATNSSAADLLGRAYGELGRKEMTKVGNQYELGQENIRGQQENLDMQTAAFQRKAGESKTSSVNSIVQAASQELARLNAAAQSASLPDRIAIEQEKARIRSDAMSRLAAFDATLNEGIAKNRPSDANAIRAEAQRLLTAGTAPENSFDFTSSIPAAFQGTGPFASPLPIFVGRPPRDEETRV